MATIPRTQMRVIPGQSVPVGVPVSDAMPRALGQLGNVLAGTATDMMAQETRQRLAEEQQRRQVEEAQAKQQDMLALQDTEQRLRDLHDDLGEQVNAGTVKAGDAETVWRERATKVQADGLGKLREGSRVAAQAQFARIDGTLARSLGKVALKRQQSEIGAGLLQSLEQESRRYAEDMTGTTARVMQALETLGPAAGMTPEQIAKEGQGWKEKAQYTLAHTAVSRGRANPAALAEAEKMIGNLPDLDPQRKSELLDRVQGYRLQQQQQAELRAARAEREQERRMRQAKAEFEAFQAGAEIGAAIDPDYLDRVQRATSGTPYAQAVVQIAKMALQTGGLAAQPVEAQRQALMAIDAQIATRGYSPELADARERHRKVLGGVEAGIKDDPLTAALRHSVITRIEPLNLAGGLPGLAQQLQQRSLLADTAATWAGRPVSPFTAQEAQTVGDLFAKMPADQRASGLQLLASQMTPQQGQALAKQIDSKDRALALALAYGSARTTQGQPTAALILRGQEALKAKTIKMDDAAETGLTASIDAELRGAISNPEQLEMARDAAKLIWAGYSADSGGRMSIPGAVRLAVGGEIVQHNGGKVILPAGVTESQFERHLERYPAQALGAQLPDGKAYVRGQPVDAAEFLSSLPKAQLRSVGRGRYAVLSGGAVATNARGVPITVEAPGAR